MTTEQRESPCRCWLRWHRPRTMPRLAGCLNPQRLAPCSGSPRRALRLHEPASLGNASPVHGTTWSGAVSWTPCSLATQAGRRGAERSSLVGAVGSLREDVMIRRGIVVTHGVGSQRRIDQLDAVVEPLMTFLGRALGYKNVHLVARTQISDDLLASAVIQLTLPNGAPEEWHVREAWWAESFRSSPSATVLPWAIGAAVFHVRSTWQNVFVRNVGRVIGRGPAPPKEGIWGVVGAGKGRAFFDVVIWLVLTIAIWPCICSGRC